MTTLMPMDPLFTELSNTTASGLPAVSILSIIIIIISIILNIFNVTLFLLQVVLCVIIKIIIIITYEVVLITVTVTDSNLPKRKAINLVARNHDYSVCSDFDVQ